MTEPVSRQNGKGVVIEMDTLTTTLQLAVPLWMGELAAMTEAQRDRTITVWAADAAEVIASNGDTLMFRSKPTKLTAAQLGANSRRKPGDEVSTAATFNHLARGLAALAYCPGGVAFGDTHWCSVEHRWGTAAQGAHPTEVPA